MTGAWIRGGLARFLEGRRKVTNTSRGPRRFRMLPARAPGTVAAGPRKKKGFFFSATRHSSFDDVLSWFRASPDVHPRDRPDPLPRFLIAGSPSNIPDRPARRWTNRHRPPSPSSPSPLAREGGIGVIHKNIVDLRFKSSQGVRTGFKALRERNDRGSRDRGRPRRRSSRTSHPRSGRAFHISRGSRSPRMGD
jgi:hypothetical protein